MSSKLDYLQKYLSQGDSLPTADNEDKAKKKKKKKSKEVKTSHVMQIYDPDDIGKFGRDKSLDSGKGKRQTQLEDDDDDDDDRFATLEEQPQVAGFIDERPDTEIMKERFTTSTFQPVSRDRRREEDFSPPRRSRQSRPIKEERDISPPRRRGDDESPPRRRPYIKEEPDASPPRRHDGHRRRSPSPPRRKSSAREDRDNSPPRRRPREERDSSPPRRNERKRDTDRRDRDSDSSPPRKRPASGDRDLSPPRHHAAVKVERDLSPPRKMFDGKKAGLQDAKSLKEELVSLKQREKEMFAQLSSEVSGRGAETQVRGRLKERAEEAQRKKEENEITDEVKQKYSRWNKGLKQTQEIRDRIASDLHEMDKPLARGADDADLDQHLKGIERAEDPMLEFLRKKRAKASGAKKYPAYQGPPPPVNRFGIIPGYRWDGVDRSNGFEKKLFERQNHRKALTEEAYKWSTEDM